MIVDGDVLLRSLDRAGAQGDAARARVEAARASGESLNVLAATVLDAIVDEPAFAVEHGPALRTAAASYRRRSIDLHDCLLGAVAGERGDRVLSFEADLRRLGESEVP